MWIEEKRQVPVKGETAVWKKEKKTTSRKSYNTELKEVCTMMKHCDICPPLYNRYKQIHSRQDTGKCLQSKDGRAL